MARAGSAGDLATILSLLGGGAVALGSEGGQKDLTGGGFGGFMKTMTDPDLATGVLGQDRFNRINAAYRPDFDRAKALQEQGDWAGAGKVITDARYRAEQDGVEPQVASMYASLVDAHLGQQAEARGGAAPGQPAKLLNYLGGVTRYGRTPLGKESTGFNDAAQAEAAIAAQGQTGANQAAQAQMNAPGGINYLKAEQDIRTGQTRAGLYGAQTIAEQPGGSRYEMNMGLAGKRGAETDLIDSKLATEELLRPERQAQIQANVAVAKAKLARDEALLPEDIKALQENNKLIAAKTGLANAQAQTVNEIRPAQVEGQGLKNDLTNAQIGFTDAKTGRIDTLLPGDVEKQKADLERTHSLIRLDASRRASLDTTALPPAITMVVKKNEALMDRLAELDGMDIEQFVGPVAGRVGGASMTTGAGLNPGESRFRSLLESITNDWAFTNGGKNLTLNELERIKKEAPQQTDPPEVARDKIYLMRRKLDGIQRRLIENPQAGDATPAQNFPAPTGGAVSPSGPKVFNPATGIFQ